MDYTDYQRTIVLEGNTDNDLMEYIYYIIIQLYYVVRN